MSHQIPNSTLWSDLHAFGFRKRCSVRRIAGIQFFFCLALFGILVWHLRALRPVANPIDFLIELKRLEKALDDHTTLETQLKNFLIDHHLLVVKKPLGNIHLPVLVIACNRIGVKRTLDALLKYRNASVNGPDLANILTVDNFPITVSHGCEHKPTADVLSEYVDNVSIIRFHDSVVMPKSNLTKYQIPYRAVARHYKFALDYMFLVQNHSAVIILEDDLDIAPDFFDYFLATLPLLQSDRSLFCVSAWNDNGRPELINPRRNDMIYRSDFFSGLGWTLLREFWLEIRNNWPDVFWDEYLRNPAVRKKRACLRPEIGRTVTFGRQGISRGQFFDKYMKTMVLNSIPYRFLQADLTYLYPDRYVPTWRQAVYNDSTAIGIDDLLADRLPQVELAPNLRVTYTSIVDFRRIAQYLNLMSDVKSGVMRTAFLGVVSVTWKRHTLYVAPPDTWQSYAESS